MARGGRKKAREQEAGQGAPKRTFAHRPFAGLGKTAAGRVALAPAPSKPDPEPLPAGSLDDDAALAELMRGVAPLDAGPPLRDQIVGPRPMLAEADDDVLVMRKLDELVHGDLPFDFDDTEEYIEAHVSDLDRRIVVRLKAGDFAVQRHLDLHGLNREEARKAVAEFLRRAGRDGLRCVLIVHGRGKGSRDNVPVLKEKLRAWLTRGAIGRRVLAYTSARPFDGGTGAVYVLLRR